MKTIWEGLCQNPTNANSKYISQAYYPETAEMERKMKKYVYVMWQKEFLRKKVFIKHELLIYI